MTSSCPSCGESGRRGRFCDKCGAALEAGAASIGPERRRASWWLVAGAVLTLGGLMAAIFVPERRARAAAAGATAAGTAAAATADAGALPDIGAMTPRERFDRLYARALEAAQSGDAAAAAQFTPMAFAAYSMLDTIDADARYHAALLHLHSGAAGPARLLADTILANEPGHLFGYLIRVSAARWDRDDAALQASFRDFLAHDSAGAAGSREEYEAHRATLDGTRRLAREALTAQP